MEKSANEPNSGVVERTRGRRVWVRRASYAVGGLFLLLLATGLYHRFKPLPEGISFAGPWRNVEDVQFLRDLTYLDASGERQVDHEIFDAVFQMIDRAERLILVDMFLFNGFQGAKPERTRALCQELTDRLLARKAAVPGLEVHLITDPINTVYNGMKSEHLEKLEQGGIQVTLTDLGRLRDSNPLYSSAWRWFIQPFGNSEGRLVPNPFGEGRVSLLSYFALLNFKANHRKVIVADGPNGLEGLVTSANPHDGSSAHQNVALRFRGSAAADLLDAELAVLHFSGGPEIGFKPDASPDEKTGTGLRMRVVSENQIERAAIEFLTSAKGGNGDLASRVDLIMFYLSDRKIIDALKSAAARGVAVRLILDPNKDAFGHEKSGIPNRQVAAELLESPGIEIRWADTHGEQCHSKMLLVRTDAESGLLLGSANYTRRNLDDYNLELNAAVTGAASEPVFQRALEYFEQAWSNGQGRRFTTDYERYQDGSSLRYWRYRVMEASGLSTF